MKQSKKIGALILSALTILATLSGCHDSGSETNTVKVDYDPAAAVEPYLDKLPELTEAEKSRVIQMGFNDCDHMVAAIIGQDAGIYEALGMNVEITKTNQVVTAVAAGEFDTAYASYSGSIRSYNGGANVITLVGSHLGGARYFVVRDETEALDQIDSLTVQDTSMQSAEWLRFSNELGIDSDYTAYKGASMAQADSMVALKADQIDGIFVCDPYASIAEFEGFGRIIDVAWGSLSEDLGIGWGECCTEMYNKDFVDQNPGLTARLVLSHCLATQYMYTHPYNSAMMFADTFGTNADVGLRTMYLKTNAEGRTMNWEISPKNIENLCEYHDYWGVPESEWPQITRTSVDAFFDLSYMEMLGIETMEEFLASSGVAEDFPDGMSYADWLYRAETIDGVDHESTVGKTVDKWMKDNVITDLPATA